ncbi:MAG: glutamyl-tRNA reductase, partial [Kiritimatiellaeota bacterium]|nr:glutamyl-tRNA reductase [Kiritimatiellota bacterium]
MNMNLAVLGINFRTAPIELRERASFAADDVPEALSRLCAEFPGTEAVLLSTCNRTELYTAGIDMEMRRSALIRMLLKGTAPHEFAAAEKHFYAKKDLSVAQHLLAVVAGLDSMVVGETEILGQVKQAYMLAEQAQTSGKALAPLFQNAFRIAKRVHTETHLCRGRVSVSSIAVEFAEKVFEDLGSKTVMIVGAGETAELALKSLTERGAKDVLVLNRSHERALVLAERYGGRAIPYDLLDDYLPRADIVISSTSAPHCVIREASVRKALAVRRGLPLLLIDIAVPRDIEIA